MSAPKALPKQKLQFYVTTPYQCGYIAKNLAQSLIASPPHVVDADVYSELITQGFRRSGKFTYRPHCEKCQACTPVRVVLDEFTPTRSQRRAYKKHQSLNANIMELQFQPEHYALYQEYQAARHSDDLTVQTETESEQDQYRHFLCQSHVESLMIEFKDDKDKVKIVSVVDIVKDGISAVYTFFDTNDASASYGTYAIMWLATWTTQLELPYLYLGYWVKESQKMAYKEKFNKQQKFINHQWQTTD